ATASRNVVGNQERVAGSTQVKCCQGRAVRPARVAPWSGTPSGGQAWTTRYVARRRGSTVPGRRGRATGLAARPNPLRYVGGTCSARRLPARASDPYGKPMRRRVQDGAASERRPVPGRLGAVAPPDRGLTARGCGRTGEGRQPAFGSQQLGRRGRNGP